MNYIEIDESHNQWCVLQKISASESFGHLINYCYLV